MGKRGERGGNEGWKEMNASMGLDLSCDNYGSDDIIIKSSACYYFYACVRYERRILVGVSRLMTRGSG